MTIEIERKNDYQMKRMPDNICDKCGSVIYPNELYFTDDKKKICVRYCSNAEELKNGK